MKKKDKKEDPVKDLDQLLSMLLEAEILSPDAMRCVRGGDGDGGGVIIIIPPPPGGES